MSEFRLSRQNNMTLDEAKLFITKYFETYPEIKTYMDQVVKDCEKTGYVSTVANRKRYIPTINDKHIKIREQAKRFAMNAPIQGSGADIMKMAMIAVDQAIKEHHFKSKIILKLDVPLLVEGNYARNWADLK